MISMFIDSVRINLQTQQRVVILKTTEQDRQLSIWIAHAEAYAIAAELQQIRSPRPLTHDLLKTIIEGSGLTVQEVRITRVQDEIYYAEIVLERAGQSLIFDARPSDALALAVRTQASILVAEDVLQIQNSSSQDPLE
jgi:uncharacterized protein